MSTTSILSKGKKGAATLRHKLGLAVLTISLLAFAGQPYFAQSLASAERTEAGSSSSAGAVAAVSSYADKGVVVVSVDEDGPASDAGLRQGDVIEEINRQPVRTPAELTAALQRPAAKPLLLLINRRGQPAYVTVQPRQ